MIKLPLKSGNEICIFSKDITVQRELVQRRIPNSNEMATIGENVYVLDGKHANGGWVVNLSYEEVVRRIEEAL